MNHCVQFIEHCMDLGTIPKNILSPFPTDFSSIQSAIGRMNNERERWKQVATNLFRREGDVNQCTRTRPSGRRRLTICVHLPYTV